MSYQKFIRKFKILLEEAEKDFKNDCYNKTVSCLWFSIEALLRAILIFEKGWCPERPGKLISLFYSFLKKKIPNKLSLIPLINSLYAHRRNADHSGKIYTKEETERIYQKSKFLIKELILISKSIGLPI